MEGSAIRVSWDAVAEADRYNVYHDDSYSPSCQVRSGRASFCEQLAADITATTYTHTSPAEENHYWVTACNRDGCSEIDSENPAAPIEPPPDNPHGVTYAVEGSAIRVGWDAVAEADHYNVYHDDFFDSACQVRSGRGVVL